MIVQNWLQHMFLSTLVLWECVDSQKNSSLIVYITIEKTLWQHTPERPAYNKQTGFIWLVCPWRGMLLLCLSSTCHIITCSCLARSKKGASARRGRRLLPSGLKKNKSSSKQVTGNGALGGCQDIVWFKICLRCHQVGDVMARQENLWHLKTW